MIFNIGSSIADPKQPIEMLQQSTAAFLAALVLPLCRQMCLQPQLPMPRLTRPHKAQTAPLEHIQKYVDDLIYYMTLSTNPASVGSVIWSIFWEPGLDCNLVSVWFGSLLEVIRHIIEAGDLEVFAKVFMARQQLPALLWYGIFTLGDIEVLNKIIYYLESHEDPTGCSSPDIDVAAWTASKQSFLDEDEVGIYEKEDSQVPRSDLLCHRFNFRLGDYDAPRYGWQPMGQVIKTEIEPELWPWLEAGCLRKYQHWIWWLPEKDVKGALIIPKIVARPDTLRVFRRDEVKYIQNTIGQQLEVEKAVITVPDDLSCEVRLEPSRKATFQIISYGSKDAAGDRSLEAMVIPNIREHTWMADSRGI